MSKIEKLKLPGKLKDKRFISFVTEQVNIETFEVLGEVEIDVKADFTVGPDLQKELSEVAALSAWYGQLREMASVMMKRQKHLWLKREEEVSAQLLEDNPKLTPTLLKLKAKVDPKLQKRIEGYMKWRARHGVLSMLYSVMEERHRTLRTMESSERKSRDAAGTR
jgi:hypothetical protein